MRHVAPKVAIARRFVGLEEITPRRRAMKTAVFTRAIGVGGFLISAGLLVAATPDFSGEWRLVLPRSRAKDKLAQQWMPREVDKAVEQNGQSLTIKTHEINPRGEFSATLHYRLDGAEAQNDTPDVKTRATTRWSGNTLIIETAGSFQGSPIRVYDRWQLSKNRRLLTVHRHFEGPPGRSDQDLVFERVNKK